MVIRAMENATGRISLIRRAKGYDADIAQGRSFWDVMVERYGLSLDVISGDLQNIPAEGPLIVVSNHPYGILDGLILGHILERRRGDFRILANQVFRKADELNRVVLPISFDESKEAVRLNLETRAKALRYLGEGGAIGIFPGGTVSTAARPMGQAMDPAWRSFTAKMVAKSGATVVPVFFEGQTSRLFQLASHLNITLRMGLLVKEFRSRVDRPVRVSIGTALPPEKLAEFKGDAKAMMDFLRKATYELSQTSIDPSQHGFEFEERYRS